MSSIVRAARAALVILAGTIVAGASLPAAAQRPRVAVARQAPPASAPATSRGSVPMLIDPNGFVGREVSGRELQGRDVPLRRSRRTPTPVVAYYPGGYPYYPTGTGGQVYDATGRPLYEADDSPGESRYAPLSALPDLSGSPYVATAGGAMLVDFGNNDRRTVPSCSAIDAERAPDGRSRTIFYRPSADAFVLRAGARGRVLGTPPAGARVCYTVDRWGREALAY